MNEYRTDYQTNQLTRIQLWGFDFWVTPRFVKLYVDRLYEPVSSRLILALLKGMAKNKAFLDIGAHYGYYSLLVATKDQVHPVLAVEPMAENAAVINKNINANHLTKIKIIEAAISDIVGTKEIRVAQASDSSSFDPHPTGQKIGGREVKTITIDQLSLNQPIGLIKLDVEGHEIPALQGAAKTIKRDQPAILFEYHPISQHLAGHYPGELIDILGEEKYRLYAISEETVELVEITGRGQDAETKALNVFGPGGYGNILATYRTPPALDKYPIPGKSNQPVKIKWEDSGIGLLDQDKNKERDWDFWWLQYERNYYRRESERLAWEVKEFKKKWIYRVGQKVKQIIRLKSSVSL